jgi:hypothetical protein
MVAAARKYRKTVQVGSERRSTPHILEARDRYIKSGKLDASLTWMSTVTTAADAIFPPTPLLPQRSIGNVCRSGKLRDYNPGSIRGVGATAASSATARPAIFACTYST